MVICLSKTVSRFNAFSFVLPMPDSHHYLLQEVMKVKGFQVAPAELEGHLLDHNDVADACVVGVPDDYSGELPFAFIVLKTEAALRAQGNLGEAARVKAAISKVCGFHPVVITILIECVIAACLRS